MATSAWILFLVFIAFMLFLDLGVFNKKSHEMSVKEALGWTAFWIVLSLAFNVVLYYMYELKWGLPADAHVLTGKDAALKFLTSYLVEKSLSLDNIFVIAMIFSFYKVPNRYQHRVLFWGILGALLMRGVMILAGAALMHRFHWLIYVFGAFLIFTAYKMLKEKDTVAKDLNESLMVRLAKEVYPLHPEFHGEKFFIKIDGKRHMTPLLLVLVIIEFTDLLFALDSIPAVLAVTTDSFIVFTSNIFAILGLRSLYFALAAIMDKFSYLKYSIIVLLAYIGVKMLISKIYPIPTEFSLGFIAAILATGVGVSIHQNKNAK